MSRSGRLFLQDMLECARKVVRYTAHLTREQFFSSELEYDATLRNLEILGEAAKKVPDELKHQYPSVDWRGIAGFRDVLIELALTPSPSPTAWARGAARGHVWSAEALASACAEAPLPHSISLSPACGRVGHRG
jgi:uncharacterized protein with HEPN domain